MDAFSLLAVSPVDGRYCRATRPLADYFSEWALMRYRVRVEVEYFLKLLSQIGAADAVSRQQAERLRSLYHTFSVGDGQTIKSIEATTNHDVKAVEYFLKDRVEEAGLPAWKEFVHFGLTSQDINNTAIPLALREFSETQLQPAILRWIESLSARATAWESLPMLARTHGQPASPTRLGKEIRVFVVRLRNQFEMLQKVPMAAKFGGATGNLNAHVVAYPGVDWKKFGDEFVQSLGLVRSEPTTQIEHYDYLAAWLDALKRINTILIDFSRDVWQYISLGYFHQRIAADEVGSSAMPHKVNPIDFENAEGNLGVANALLEHLSSKLPVSRLQRDLTDSTVLRNLGVPLAHTWIALESLQKGWAKLEVNEVALQADLEANWAVVAEGIQTILRREGFPKPYEALKALTRTHEKITRASIHQFIDSLEVKPSVKEELKRLSPFTYTGI